MIRLRAVPWFMAIEIFTCYIILQKDFLLKKKQLSERSHPKMIFI